METDLKIFDVVDSTNAVLKNMADGGASEGTCVLALSQTKGRGRSGRSFFSPQGGNLYMSLLLRPDSDEKFLKITMASAVAVSEAVDDNFGIKTGIKWVNDIFYNNRKISGTVAEAHNVGEPDRYVILGIGVNIYRNTSVPDDISGIYGSIKDTVCDLSKEEQVRSASALSSAITDRFGIYYDDPVRSGLIDRYRARSMVIGCDVYYMCGDIELPAHVVGIDDDGGIMLDMNGEVRVYRDGEIRIRLSDM